jgi:excisionase family DNA binding protein
LAAHRRSSGRAHEYVSPVVRRLIAQRRIEFVKVGRHVRISESALAEFIEAGRVRPMTAADLWHKMKGVA